MYNKAKTSIVASRKSKGKEKVHENSVGAKSLGGACYRKTRRIIRLEIFIDENSRNMTLDVSNVYIFTKFT